MPYQCQSVGENPGVGPTGPLAQRGNMQLRDRPGLGNVLDAKGLSERALARKAGLGHATVNHLVTGRRTSCSAATAAAIEKALSCGPGTLFYSCQTC